MRVTNIVTVANNGTEAVSAATSDAITVSIQPYDILLLITNFLQNYAAELNSQGTCTSYILKYCCHLM